MCYIIYYVKVGYGAPFSFESFRRGFSGIGNNNSFANILGWFIKDLW